MNEPKKEPGFFESVMQAGTRSIRHNVAKRLGRAWEHGFALGQNLPYVPEARPHDANPYVDRDGDPKLDPEGMPVTSDPG